MLSVSLTGRLAIRELVGGLLIVEPGYKEQDIEPRRSAAEGGAAGHGAEIGKDDEASGRE